VIRLATLLSILILTGCTLAQQGAFDLESYGRARPASLVGNGIADDTTDLQAILDVGGQVSIPAGTFRVTAPLRVHRYTDIRGSGRTLTKIVLDHNGIGFDLGSGGGYAGGDTTIRNLSVWGNGNSTGIKVGDGAGFSGQDRLDDVQLYNHSVGLLVTSSLRTLVERCQIHYNGTGISLEPTGDGYVTTFTVSDSWITNNTGNGFRNLSAIRAKQVTFRGCNVEYNGSGNTPQIATGGVDCFTFTDGYLEHSGENIPDGIHVHDANAVRIAGTYFNGTRNAIYSTSYDGLSITACRFVGSVNRCVLLVGGANCQNLSITSCVMDQDPALAVANFVITATGSPNNLYRGTVSLP
jgi:hypothetical protein